MSKRYSILKELIKFPRRRDKSGRYKMGRAINESEVPYLEGLYSMGYINLGFDFKTRQNTMSITKKGQDLANNL